MTNPSLLSTPTDNSGYGINADAVNLTKWCGRFYTRIKIPTEIEQSKISGVLAEMSSQVSKNTNIETPSVFKRAAGLTMAFMVKTPLTRNFSGSTIGKDLLRIENHHNAIASFEYCRFALEGAILRPAERTEFVLKKPIAVSEHFYRDLIHALSRIKDRSYCFHATALLYESLCYKANEGASDPEIA